LTVCDPSPYFYEGVPFPAIYTGTCLLFHLSFGGMLFPLRNVLFCRLTKVFIVRFDKNRIPEKPLNKLIKCPWEVLRIFHFFHFGIKAHHTVTELAKLCKGNLIAYKKM